MSILSKAVKKPKTKVTFPPIKTWDNALKETPFRKVSVILILGHRRMGKSGTGWWLLEKLHHKYKGKAVVAIGMAKSKRKLVPPWVKHIDDALKLPENAIVLADEAAIRYSARRSFSDPNVVMSGMIGLSGQRKQIIIFIAHTARLLEVEQVFDSDLVVYKLPSAAHVKFERRETAEYTLKARNALLEKRDPRKWAYILDFHFDRQSLLRTGLPTFWSEELSHAWAGLDVASLVQRKENGKNGKRR